MQRINVADGLTGEPQDLRYSVPPRRAAIGRGRHLGTPRRELPGGLSVIGAYRIRIGRKCFDIIAELDFESSTRDLNSNFGTSWRDRNAPLLAKGV